MNKTAIGPYVPLLHQALHCQSNPRVKQLHDVEEVDLRVLILEILAASFSGSFYIPSESVVLVKHKH